MPTIGWKDASFTEKAGPVRVHDRMVMVRDEHLARWKEDPEGRFGVSASHGEGGAAVLEKFYPSL